MKSAEEYVTDLYSVLTHDGIDDEDARKLIIEVQTNALESAGIAALNAIRSLIDGVEG